MSIESVNPWTNPDAGDEESDNDALSTLRRAGRASQADSTSDGSETQGSETDDSRPHIDPLDWSTALPLGVLGGIDPESPGDADTVAVMEGLTQLRCGEAFLGWARYQSIGVLYDRLVVERAKSDGLIVDGFADAAARISGIFAVSRPQAERMLDDAIVLRDDLPQVFGCLRDGIVSVEQARLVISRTDLVRAGRAPRPRWWPPSMNRSRQLCGRGAGRGNSPACATWSIGSCSAETPTRYVNAASALWTSGACSSITVATGSARSPRSCRQKTCRSRSLRYDALPTRSATVTVGPVSNAPPMQCSRC